MSKICLKCGKNFSDSTIYCPICGGKCADINSNPCVKHLDKDIGGEIRSTTNKVPIIFVILFFIVGTVLTIIGIIQGPYELNAASAATSRMFIGAEATNREVFIQKFTHYLPLVIGIIFVIISVVLLIIFIIKQIKHKKDN